MNRTITSAAIGAGVLGMIEAERYRAGSHTEMLRMLREEEPPRPSERKLRRGLQ